MTRSALNRLGELERAVMDEVWQANGEDACPISVRQVQGRLGDARPLAYTTVMTVMTRLLDKGLLTRTKHGRAFLYAPVTTRELLSATTMHDQLQGMDRVERRAALTHFLDHASAEDLRDLREALDEAERQLPGRLARLG
ncbi:MAG: BlaI/MecI/CopY family transcriptional regulator [Micrococcales bacterium]|nr:BlaI/MecI/CopY family transcriptional regulator [Micrococcales bacterium]